MAKVSCDSICSIASYFDPEKYGDDSKNLNTGHISFHRNTVLSD